MSQTVIDAPFTTSGSLPGYNLDGVMVQDETSSSTSSLSRRLGESFSSFNEDNEDIGAPLEMQGASYAGSSIGDDESLGLEDIEDIAVASLLNLQAQQDRDMTESEQENCRMITSFLVYKLGEDYPNKPELKEDLEVMERLKESIAIMTRAGITTVPEVEYIMKYVTRVMADHEQRGLDLQRDRGELQRVLLIP